jgi:hypothetical protein
VLVSEGMKLGALVGVAGLSEIVALTRFELTEPIWFLVTTYSLYSRPYTKPEEISSVKVVADKAVPC